METNNEEIRAAIAEGLLSLRRGEGIDGEEFFAQLEREEAERIGESGICSAVSRE